jgi:hypothetical protein
MADFPIGLIPEELRAWVDKGWRLGTYMDSYTKDEEAEEDEGDEPEEIDEEASLGLKTDWDVLQKWQSQGPGARPKEFNRRLMAVVRFMAENYNNWEVAYAMDRTKRFFSEEEVKESFMSAPVKKWRDAQSEFYHMSQEDQFAWQRRVKKRYPRLDHIVAEI